MTGYMHPVYKRLAKALREFADVQVVAPDRNRSGASNSLTLDPPCARLPLKMVILLCKWEPRPIASILA
ncbi:stationary phase survival protein SurE [Escherichia coli]|uniref:5'-nucleotidase n=1 Tax=Escherichia coli TaxID=562 RepID=A0A377CWR3_ECOLX|nr:stationary phase survival protein SurE [Escherichia coli]